MNGTSEACAARELGVPSRLDRNSKAISELAQLACKLEDRLLSISQPLPNQEPLKPADPKPTTIHVHDKLDSQFERIISVIKRVEGMLGRLEV